MEPNLSRPTQPSKLPKWLTTVTPFSKALAMILFILLPFAGFYLGMKYQQQISVSVSNNNLSQSNALPTPMPTSTVTIMPSPDPLISSASAGWLTFTSPRKDYSINFPANWIYKLSPNAVTDINIQKPFGSGFSEFTPAVWISKSINKTNADFLTFVTGGNSNIEKNIKVTDKQIGDYNVKEVVGLPSQMGEIDVYFPLNSDSFIDVAFTPYPPAEYTQDFNIFQNMLSSFKLMK